MERLGTLPFVAQPGEAWVYGYNTDILGCVVEKASGMPLDAVLRQRITAPLGMKDTQFFLPPDQKDAAGRGLCAAPRTARPSAHPKARAARAHYVDGPRRNFAGGAGLTVHRPRLREVPGDDSQRRLRSTACAFLSPRSRQADDAPTRSARCIRPTASATASASRRPIATARTEWSPAGAFGWAGAYGSIYRIDPKRDLSILMMIQLMPNTTDIRTKFPAMVYQALNER